MDSPKVEIIYPTIERWHCVDLMLRNLEKAEKPDNIQILAIVSASDKFTRYLEKGLKKIFSKVRIIKNNELGIEHDELRESFKTSQNWNNDLNKEKIKKIYRTYKLAVENMDKNVDYYWFIEDDTLFPLDTYSRYWKLFESINADVVSGVSYYWHDMSVGDRNFWNLILTNQELGYYDITPMQSHKNGIVRLGATGLGNVLARAKAVQDWNPTYSVDLGSGADISFFANCFHHNYIAYGIWDLFLPHITKYDNGDIAILGRIDKSLLKILNKE